MYLDKRVSGNTIITGLIGNPVRHTVSPVLHNSLFNMLGIDGIYMPMEVRPASLGAAVKGLEALGFTGFNVTIPFKEEIMNYLDVISEEARLFGAVNTVTVTDGKLIGYNTDGDGFSIAFREQAGCGFKNKKICVLGAGGTARSIAFKAALEGASAISIINRTVKKADELVLRLKEAARSGLFPNCNMTGLTAAALGSEDADILLSECDIIINTTSVGMYPNIHESPLHGGFTFKSSQIVFDAIYNPPKTKLLIDAELNGCRIINGAGMLFYQGVRAFEIWTGKPVPDKITGMLIKEFINYLKK